MSDSCCLLFERHLQSGASELTFVLTRGGHNVGIGNDQPIACGCAQAFRGIGADLCIAYLNEQSRKFTESLTLSGLGAGVLWLEAGCSRPPRK